MELFKNHKTLLNNTGSVLISLIITMVVLAALGAAMVSLTSTSMFGQVGANSSARAYFLAESGYRYAESRFMNADSLNEKDRVLEEDLHGETFELLDNAGEFNFQIYPYFAKVDPAVTAGTSPGWIRTRVAGGIPTDISLSNGRLKIGTKTGNIYSYTGVSPPSVIDGKTYVTFTGVTPQPFPYFPLNTDALPVARSSSSSQNINEGEVLLLEAGTANAFPRRNGTFQVNNRVYAYKENDLANNRLLGVTDPKVSPMSPLPVAAGSDVVLQKFVKLHSTGVFGQGSVEGAASREVAYHVPLPSTAEERREFKETFADLSNWKSSTLGSFALQSIGGDNALRVTGTEVFQGFPKASLIRFDPSSANIDLAAAHQYGDPYFLSYDAQVKVGFDSSTTPDYGFDPIPIPIYYAAGLSFRLDNNNNSYGISFLRGNNNSSLSPYPDNIDDGIVPPLNRKNLIVLWKLTNSGATAEWLAYKKNLALFFKDDMESGTNGWTFQLSPTGLWHQSARRSNSTATAWYYGKEATGTYDTGAQNNGALESPSIDLSLATSATLTYWTWIYTEPGGGTTYDRKYLLISVDGGAPFDLPGSEISDDFRTWHQRSYDLSAYCGHQIKIRFRFDTVDSAANNYEGWYIDDVRISGDTAASINEATLAVKVKEAASITFIGGNYGAGSTPIENLDTAVGQTSGARGVVSGSPIISSGSWASSNAAGTLILKNTVGTFSSGEQIQVIGSSAAATVSGFRPRDNFIRAYYGNTSGYGTPDSNPLDDEKKANLRGSVNWPPDEVADWSATNDYYTLVQWDAVNTGVTRVSSLTEPFAIIRDSTLTSPTSGLLAQPELGLHAFGKGATNVYFDDFAVQADIGASGITGFVRTIQE